MSKQQNTKVSRIKAKKKAWFQIISPKLFGSKEMGETYNISAKNAVGRTIKVNLKDLTVDVKDQTAYAHFEISGVEGNSLKTECIGYELTPSFIKRLVRKNSDKIEGNFYFKTHKNEYLTIKWLIVTLNKVNHSLQTQIRKQINSLLETEVEKEDFTSFMGNLVYKKSHFAMKKKLSKIYPLKELVFRMIISKPTGDNPLLSEGKSPSKEEGIAKNEVQEEQLAMQA